MTDTPALDADALTERLWAAVPITSAMGLRIVEIRPGRVTAEIPLEPNVNHFQAMYAGALFTVAEVLGGAIAVVTFELGSYVPLVKDMRIRFRRPAASAVRATAELSRSEAQRVMADAEATGKGEFVLVASLTDQRGEIVAETSGTYQLRRI
jgi:thioesterase domain-containing protein